MAKKTARSNARTERTQAAMPRRQTRSTERPTQERQRRSSQPASSRSSSSAPPFLTADDLKDGPNPFIIGEAISIFQRNDGSTVLFINVERAGGRNEANEIFTWAMNCKSPDRSALQEQAGRNMINWPGKRIALVPVQGSRGGWFVNLDRPDRPADDDIPF